MQNGMITRGNWNIFLTLKDERLLLVKRQHPFVIIIPVFLACLLTVLLISIALIFFQDFFVSQSLLLVTAMLLLSIGISLVTKILIDWYFHMYILTNRKIIELRYTPLASYVANDVMLDRVNCTEIDMRTNGIINEILDIGDVLLTFDRPTHQEEFVIKDVRAPHELATYLTQQLMDGTHAEIIQNTIWFRHHNANSAG